MYMTSGSQLISPDRRYKPRAAISDTQLSQCADKTHKTDIKAPQMCLSYKYGFGQ